VRGEMNLERFFTRNRIFWMLIYTLLGLFILYMLMLISPMIHSVYSFLKTILAPFIIAMIISYILNPIVCILHDRKMPRTIAVLLIYTVFIISVTVIFMNLIPVLMKQIKELTEHLPQMTIKAEKWFSGLSQNKMVPDSVREGLQRSLSKLENLISLEISNAVTEIGSTIDLLFVAFIIPFLAFYMLKDFQIIEKTALTVVPKKHRDHTIRLFVDIDHALGNYIRGQVLVCLIVGGLAYLGYWLIGMPYPLLLASIVALFNIIPYLGPFFGAFPALVMASTISLKMVLLVAVTNLVVQILEGNVISPQVVGRKLQMHPLLIIFALLVGGELAGVVGLILAVPVFAVIKVIAHHIYVYYKDSEEAASGK
jgi:predicted PurR-regulated permease PerM